MYSSCYTWWSCLYLIFTRSWWPVLLFLRDALWVCSAHTQLVWLFTTVNTSNNSNINLLSYLFVMAIPSTRHNAYMIRSPRIGWWHFAKMPSVVMLYDPVSGAWVCYFSRLYWTKSGREARGQNYLSSNYLLCHISATWLLILVFRLFEISLFNLWQP